MSESEVISISLYDDNAEFRSSLVKLFSRIPGFELIAAYADANQIIENCLFQKPEVILMDIDMPGIAGFDAVKLIRERFPEIKVLMLTVFDDNYKVFESIRNGALGYILKKADPTDIVAAVKEVHVGGAPMTPVIATKVIQMFREYAPLKDAHQSLSEREKEVLALLTRGFSYKMIAAECAISLDTVRFHIKNIYEKLQVHSMTEAVSKALKHKWVQ